MERECEISLKVFVEQGHQLVHSHLGRGEGGRNTDIKYFHHSSLWICMFATSFSMLLK